MKIRTPRYSVHYVKGIEFNMLLSDVEISESEMLRHYVHFWGNPVNIFAETAPVFPLKDLYACSFKLADDYHVFATVGMSQCSMEFPEISDVKTEEHRVEILFYVHQMQIEIADVLLGLAQYPFFHHTYIGVGHRIPGTKSVLPESSLTDIVFVPPLNEDKSFRSVHVESNIHVDILWALPIFQSESMYLKKFGWKSLVKLFVQNDIDCSNLARSAVV